jgi:ectoine hydroxylase-related dioxygenase (phytanoyl-CoA dioxygenase family)
VSEHAEQFEREGFEITPTLLSERTRTAYLTALTGRVPRLDDTRRARAGLRNLTSLVPETLDLIDDPAVAALLLRAIGKGATLVRAILFDKTAGTNWKVPWHQDLFVALKQRHDVAGFETWTRKDGVAHARPPLDFLRSMLTLRIHLDDCGAANGPLSVIPRSHRAGLITDEARRELIANGPRVACLVGAGAAMIMRPLLLHSSTQSSSPSRRRVVHLEFASSSLPPPLQWHLDAGL